MVFMFSSSTPTLSELLIEAEKIFAPLPHNQEQLLKLNALTDYLFNLSQSERYQYFHRLLELNPDLISLAKHQLIDEKFFAPGDYLNLCMFAVKQGHAEDFDFEFNNVRSDLLNAKEYESLCRSALKDNAVCDELQYMDVNILTEDGMLKICEDAMKNNDQASIPYYCARNMTIKSDLYFKICMLAFGKYNFELSSTSIKFEKLGSDEEEKKDRYFAICKAAVMKSGLNLKNVAYESLPEHKYDLICTLAVNNDPLAIEHIKFHYLLQKDNYERLALEAVKKNGLALGKINSRYVTQYLLYKEIIPTAIKQNGLAIQYLGPHEFEYKDLCKTAVQQNGLALKYINSKSLDKALYMDLCQMAVAQNGLALQYIDTSCIADPAFLQTLITSTVQKNSDIFKENPGVLRFVLEKSDEKNQIAMIELLSLDAILKTDVTLYRFLPKQNQDIEERACKLISAIDHVVVVRDEDRSDGEIQDSYLVYANKENKNKPEKSRKGKTILCNKGTVENALKVISDVKAKLPVSNDINLVLLSHFGAGYVAIADMRVANIVQILETVPRINRVTLLGCETVEMTGKLQQEEEITKRYTMEKSKEDHIYNCTLVSIGRMPKEEELQRLFKKYQAVFILIGTKKKDEHQYQMMYAEPGKQQVYELNQAQVEALEEEFNNNKKIKFLGKDKGPNVFQREIETENEKEIENVNANANVQQTTSDNKQKKTTPLLLDYEDRLYIKDICTNGVPGFSTKHKDYHQRKKVTPSLSNVSISINDPEFAKANPDTFICKLAQAIAKNLNIKQKVTLKGYNGLLSVSVKELIFVITKNFIYKHRKYGPAIFANKSNEDAIDQKQHRKGKRAMIEDKKNESNVKSVSIDIPGKTPGIPGKT